MVFVFLCHIFECYFSLYCCGIYPNAECDLSLLSLVYWLCYTLRMYTDVFFLVCFICIGVRIASKVCSDFCCISLVVHIGAQPVVPLVCQGLNRAASEVRFRGEI